MKQGSYMQADSGGRNMPFRECPYTPEIPGPTGTHTGRAVQNEQNFGASLRGGGETELKGAGSKRPKRSPDSTTISVYLAIALALLGVFWLVTYTAAQNTEARLSAELEAAQAELAAVQTDLEMAQDAWETARETLRDVRSTLINIEADLDLTEEVYAEMPESYVHALDVLSSLLCRLAE